MIDEPACSSGSSSSPRPAAGPLASRRMSLAILVSATATPRRPLDASARAPWPPWWTIGLSVVRRSNSVSSAIDAITSSANPSGALIPVPTAVPPRGSSPSAARSATERASARSSRPAQASASWPTVTGVASIRCVRPALTAPIVRSLRLPQLADEQCEARVGVLGQLGDHGEADRRSARRRSTTARR